MIDRRGGLAYLDVMSHANLWAPWRMEYVRQLDPPDDPSACFICDAWHSRDDDAQRLVIERDDAGLILLNRFPYTNGHLLVALGDHIGELDQLDSDQLASLMRLTARAARLLNVSMNPQGLNVGMNVGRCAGAGLPGHLHMHIVPRWNGDTNFMTIAAQVRVVPQALEEVYSELRAVRDQLDD
jgi:ATP adenylyltransferase